MANLQVSTSSKTHTKPARSIALAVLLVGVLLVAACGEKGGQSMSNQVIITTTDGKMVLELYPDKAPETVRNFLTYVDEGYYDNTLFHRVIKNFMIQGGGFNEQNNSIIPKQEGLHAAVQNEASNGLSNDRGTIAMARTSDPHSATSQFFINHKDNPFLNFQSETPRGWGYTVFGKLVEGQETLDTIADAPTTTMGPYADVPNPPVKIIKIERAQ